MVRRRALWGGIVLFGLAFLTRLVYIHEISDTPLFTVPIVDARTYAEEALYLSEISWSGRDAPFWQPPLYPYALGSLFALIGENYYLPRLLQALLGALICVLVYLIGRRIFTARIGIGAALAAAFYGPLIYFGGELLPVIPAVFFNLVLLYFLIASNRLMPDGARAFIAGILCGLSALTIANILLFIPILGGWFYWLNQRAGRGLRTHLIAPTLLILGAAVIIAPVTYRNWTIGGDQIMISHNAGINFYIGNNADYQGTTAIRPGGAWNELVEMPEREANIEVPSEKSRFFFALSWDYIVAQPLDYLYLLAYKSYLFFRGDELPRNLDPYFARNNSTLLSLTLWKHGLAFPFGLVGTLALVGLYAFFRKPENRSPESILLLLFIASYTLSVILFFITSRYRLPTVPILLLFAAYGVRSLWNLPRPALLAVPVLLLLGNTATGAMNTEGDAHEHYWLGYAYEQQNMPANAARHYRRAIEMDPSFEEPYLDLAALHGAAKRYDEASKIYQRYLTHFPHSNQVRYLLGNTYLIDRRYDKAISTYAEVAAARPNWAAIHGHLGYALLMTDQPERAAAAYRRTLELNPDSTLVRYQLARLYSNKGQTDQAIGEFQMLIQQQPQAPEHRIRLADLLIEWAARNRQGISLPRSASLEQAENHLRHAIELAPQTAHSHWSLGMLYARQGHYEKAIPIFANLLEIAPRDYQAHLFLGHLYERTGNSDQATIHFEKFSRNKRAYNLEKTARREFEAQIKDIFGN